MDETRRFFNYSKSDEFGFRPGSFERNPNVKSEIKKITTVYTRILRDNIHKNGEKIKYHKKIYKKNACVVKPDETNYAMLYIQDSILYVSLGSFLKYLPLSLRPLFTERKVSFL
jgi:hypothetical protein